jgi:hypothetical protein
MSSTVATTVVDELMMQLVHDMPWLLVECGVDFLSVANSISHHYTVHTHQARKASSSHRVC